MIVLMFMRVVARKRRKNEKKCVVYSEIEVSRIMKLRMAIQS